MGTSCLILGANASKAVLEAWFNSAIFPVADIISNVLVLAPESSAFNNKVTLEKSISKQIIGETTRSQAYKLESIPKWYYGI